MRFPLVPNNSAPVSDVISSILSGAGTGGGFSLSLPGGLGGIGFSGRTKGRTCVNAPQTALVISPRARRASPVARGVLATVLSLFHPAEVR
jgi:hypothetical protein